jgi:hypothetical protein
VTVAVLVPVAWFVPDILGSGNPLEGGETARGTDIEPLDFFAVLWRTLAAPLAAAWLGLALLLWRERDELERPLAILLAGAAAWVLLVAVMAIAGFAGLPRFLAPATALVAVIGAVGIARAGRSGHLNRYAAQKTGALAAVAVVLAVAGFGWRLAQIPGDVEVVERQQRSLDQLFELVDETGKAQLLACGGTVRMTQVRPQTALAWKLDEPIASIPVRRKPRYGVALSTKPLGGGEVIASAGRWRATRFPCPTR